MVKRILALLIVFMISPFLYACQQEQIVTSTGGLGHRAEKLQKMLPNSSTKKTTHGSNIIYLGREYENNHFGPAGIKFVFEK